MFSGRSKPTLTLNLRRDADMPIGRLREFSRPNSPSPIEAQSSAVFQSEIPRNQLRGPLNNSNFTFQSPEHDPQASVPTFDIGPFEFPQTDSVRSRNLMGPYFANSGGNSRRNSVLNAKQNPEVSVNVSPVTESKLVVRSIATSQKIEPDPQLKFHTPKNKRLNGLYDALMKVFLEKSCPILKENLKPMEQALLVRIIKRKFGRDDWLRVSQILSDFAVEIQGIRTPRINEMKRKEERTKFIYKYVLKELKTEFDKNHEVKSNEFEHFYNYYFGDLSKERGYPLHFFFDPSNRKVLNGFHANEYRFKTINNEFLDLVFSSELFKIDFLQYLQSSKFMSDFELKLTKKIHKLLTRWNKLAGCKKLNEIEAEADEYFINSKRCKLPWTIFEVLNAREHFLVNFFKIGYE